MSKPFWAEGPIGRQKFVLQNGFIFGRVIWIPANMEYKAEAREHELGFFYTMESAQQAVERELLNINPFNEPV